MGDVTIGLLHPGEMGAAVGQCLAGAGHRVLWAPDGRSAATSERAAAAGLTGCGLAEMIGRSDLIMSVCPPAAARLYLSGPHAEQVRALFDGTAVSARVVERADAGAGVIGAASAVKMAYASWTKGTAALLLAARALARAEGVESDLLAEWGISQPGLDERSAGAAGSAAAKGWRWVAEMEEIAAAMSAAGLPGGFHRAAAEIYRRAPRDEGLDGLLSALISGR